MTTTLTLSTGGARDRRYIDVALSDALTDAFGTDHGTVPVPPEYLEILNAVRETWTHLITFQYRDTGRRSFIVDVVIVDANVGHTPPEVVTLTVTTAASADISTAPSGALEVV